MSQSQVNALSTDAFPAVASILPIAQATGTVATGWVDISAYRRIAFYLDIGNTGGSATVDAVVKQASDTNGTGSKNLSTSKAITQITATGKQVVVNVAMPDMDSNNSFRYASLLITVGTATALISCDILGDPTYTPPTLPSYVAQVIL